MTGARVLYPTHGCSAVAYVHHSSCSARLSYEHLATNQYYNLNMYIHTYTYRVGTSVHVRTDSYAVLILMVQVRTLCTNSTMGMFSRDPSTNTLLSLIGLLGKLPRSCSTLHTPVQQVNHPDSRCATYRGTVRSFIRPSSSAIALRALYLVPCVYMYNLSDVYLHLVPCTLPGLPQATRTVRRYIRRSKQPLRAGLRGSSDIRHQYDAALGGRAARAAAGLLADDAAGDEGPARVAPPRRLDHFVMGWLTSHHFIIIRVLTVV